jgi:hypothetical protein
MWLPTTIGTCASRLAITDVTADRVTAEQVSQLSAAVIAGIAVGSCAVSSWYLLRYQKMGMEEEGDGLSYS